MKRVHVYFSGTVQGVGFRFTTRNIAKRLGIVGWVKNLSDGRVEITAEGKEEELKEFLEQIKKSSVGRYISNEDISWSEASNEFSSFKVKYF